MDAFRITGGRRLQGRVTVNGSKNAALPLLAATLLADVPVALADVPDLRDIDSMLTLLQALGCEVDVQVPALAASGRASGSTSDAPVQGLGRRVRITAEPAGPSHAPYEIVRTMRASISVLGPLLARRGYARVSMPGGCAIGDRPVDLHLKGLAALGADISLDGGDIIAKAPASGLRGSTVFLGGPFGSTVLGTANVMSAATLARGTTVIESAACEPEIVDLANLLRSMGARIKGDGSPRITVHGVESLGAPLPAAPAARSNPDEPHAHAVIPDRIEAGTWIAASAITDGDITIHNCPLDALLAFTTVLESCGIRIDVLDDASRPTTLARVADPMRCTVRVTRTGALQPAVITTQPHPGFPTDLQAQTMAVLALAEGNSIVTERIFPDRFLHVAELSRMGANLVRQGPTVVISGVRHLRGAPVMASDLRASASLVLAGLAAHGQTTVHRVYHLDRGYERMDDRLRALGAEIERVETPAA